MKKKKSALGQALEQMAAARRTSVVIPEELWLASKARAAQEHVDLRSLIIQGLVWVTTTDLKKRSAYLLLNYRPKKEAK